jgi:hypothetical protein
MKVLSLVLDRGKCLAQILLLDCAFPRGQKPGLDSIGLVGLTEVMPFYKTSRIDRPLSFSPSCEVVP